MDADAARSQLAAALVRTGTGDRAALRIVYQDTSAKLFGVLLRILKDRSEAEDVLQDVYVTVWRKATLYNPDRASPITWLVAIARNRAIDRLRSGAVNRRTDPIEQANEVRDVTPGALDMVVKAEQQARLGVCLGELEEKTTQANRSAYLDGMTY
jgi:RNA polymerase sigma-70 factor (ECF subfamily)